MPALFRPTFTDLRAELERLLAQGASRAELDTVVQQFLDAGGDTPAPIVEYDGTVTWIYRDPHADAVAVVGDVLGYDTRRTEMTRLAGTDLFFFSAQLPLDAQLSYAFAVNNPCPEDSRRESWLAWLARCRVDPLNPRRSVELHPLREVSVLHMPSAPAASDIPAPAPVDAVMHLVWSAVLGAGRRIWLHLPPGYDPRTRRYPALYLADGESYLLAAAAADLADELVETGEIGSAVLVFVESLTHPDDDVPAELFVRFLAQELVPWLEARCAVSPDPRDRIVAGTGPHGAMALFAVLERPDVFGGALAQSPTPLLLPEDVAARVRENVARGYDAPRCYVDIGRYDAQPLVANVHALCGALLDAGAVLSYQEFPGERSFVGWRASLPDALRFHLGQMELLR
jgi:enterochelin esterase family protein